MSEIILPLTAGSPTANSLGFVRTSAGRTYLTADGTTDQMRVWQFKLPSDYASGAAIRAQCSMASATTGNAALRIETMAASPGDAVGTDSFDALEASADVAVPASAGNLFEITKTLTNTDGLAAGDAVWFIIGRENGTVGSNATGNMHIHTLTFEYTPTP